MAIYTGFKFDNISRIKFSLIVLGGMVGTLSGCANLPSASTNAASILYTIKPLEAGGFNPMDIKLDLNSDRYVTPANDGYGVYRIDGTNICFHASYSDRERCIDYEIHYEDWSVGDSWPIKSFDGSDVVVTVKEIVK